MFPMCISVRNTTLYSVTALCMTNVVRITYKALQRAKRTPVVFVYRFDLYTTCFTVYLSSLSDVIPVVAQFSFCIASSLFPSLLPTVCVFGVLPQHTGAGYRISSGDVAARYSGRVVAFTTLALAKATAHGGVPRYCARTRIYPRHPSGRPRPSRSPPRRL